MIRKLVYSQESQHILNNLIKTLFFVMLLSVYVLLVAIHPVTAQESTPLLPVTEAEDRLGICYTFYEEEFPQLAYNAGSRWDRFDFRWNVIEDTQGTFTFSGHEKIVGRDLTDNINIVGILGSTANWATNPDCPVRMPRQSPALTIPGHPRLPDLITDDYWWRHCAPVNLGLPWDNAENYWGNYVYQTVTHFKGQVKVWELWNEPDLPHFWSGSPKQYAQLLKVGYQAAKAADPDVTVLFAGLAYWGNPQFYVDVLDELQKLEGAAENNYYFDALSLHLYSNIYNIGWITNQIMDNMEARVGHHPIWLTETGVPLWDENPGTPGTPYRYAATIDEAAAYTIEGYAEARLAGIDKFFFFRMHDEQMSESFGLIRNDHSLRPAYVAYQVTARYLRGENEITRLATQINEAQGVTFWGSAYGRVDVLWNNTGKTLHYTQTAILPTATLVDAAGITETLTAEEGVYTITLAAATANNTPDSSYMIGGEPKLLIQEDTQPPISALHPITPDLYTGQITMTWDIDDDLSGYWYQEIEIAPGEEGPWQKVAGITQTQSTTQTQITLPGQETQYQPWYFRSRARDRVGNWEAWPTTAEVDTDFPLTRTVALSVTAYGELQGTMTIKLPQRDVNMTWTGPDSKVVAQTVAGTWQVTQTVDIGQHLLTLQHPDYATEWLPFTVLPGTTTLHIEKSIDLRSGKNNIYLPLIMRRNRE